MADRVDEIPSGKYWDIKTCGSPRGCPNSQLQDRMIHLKIAQVLEQSGLDAHREAQLGGRVLTHQMFRVAVAGCSNSCSEPQIRDFAFVGAIRPSVTADGCSGCGACTGVCLEHCIKIDDTPIPIIDRGQCVDCGLCVGVCPTGTLAAERQGVRVTVGGRLGRHPVLARTLADLVSEDEALRILGSAVALYMTLGKARDRFSHLVDRLGVDGLRDSLSQ